MWQNRFKSYKNLARNCPSNGSLHYILKPKNMYLYQYRSNQNTWTYLPMTFLSGSVLSVRKQYIVFLISFCIIWTFWVVRSVPLAQMGENKTHDAVSRETHEEEMDGLKLEIQQCKDFIQTQQQLLQVRLTFALPVILEFISSCGQC